MKPYLKYHEDEYQISIRYSYRYTIEDRVVYIECFFEDYLPMWRTELENPDNLENLTPTQRFLIQMTTGGLGMYSGGFVEFIRENAYQKGADPYTLVQDDADPSGYRYPVITGFKTILETKPEETSEITRKRVKGWTKEVVSLILHSPLLKLIGEDTYHNPIFFETKPKGVLNDDTYKKHWFNDSD